MSREGGDGTRGAAPIEGAAWELVGGEGAGPFTSRVGWRLPDGAAATWESRAARKRGLIRIRRGAGGATEEVIPPGALARRLRRLNWVAAVAFFLGGSLFALGAVVAQLGSGSAVSAASIYLVGGAFFSTGAYASLLGAINSPRSLGPDGAAVAEPWRWWAYEPQRIDWLATFVLFVGTLAFAISLIDSFGQGLSAQGVNRLIWAPELTGCILFLVSGHLSMAEISHRGRPCFRPRDLGWWIVAINQVGSILFMISALAAFTRPETGSEVNVDIANWGTLTGALCFAAGGVLQAFERPAAAVSPQPGAAPGGAN